MTAAASAPLFDLAVRLGQARTTLAVLITDSNSGQEVARLKGKREGVQLALSYLEEFLRTRQSGVELNCDDCQQPYGVWFAENDVWNFVMGGPECKGDPGGMLCPRCFTVRAEDAYDQTAIWRLTWDNRPVEVTP